MSTSAWLGSEIDLPYQRKSLQENLVILKTAIAGEKHEIHGRYQGEWHFEYLLVLFCLLRLPVARFFTYRIWKAV
jgi:hypothetical protein